jgi:hypothetical protein
VPAGDEEREVRVGAAEDDASAETAATEVSAELAVPPEVEVSPGAAGAALLDGAAAAAVVRCWLWWWCRCRWCRFAVSTKDVKDDEDDEEPARKPLAASETDGMASRPAASMSTAVSTSSADRTRPSARREDVEGEDTGRRAERRGPAECCDTSKPQGVDNGSLPQRH